MKVSTHSKPWRLTNYQILSIIASNMIDNIKQLLTTNNNSKTSFWFIRHGESEANVAGTQCLVMNNAPLTENGRTQATACAEYLHRNNITVTHIYSSPLDRSRQTAEIIGSTMNANVYLHNNLRERNWGVWGDLPWDQVSNNLSGMDIKTRYSFIPEGGESWEQMEQRLFHAFEEIAKKAIGEEHILIVTHRGCLRAVLPLFANTGKDKHEDFSVETGSLTKFSFQEQRFEFIGLNPSKN